MKNNTSTEIIERYLRNDLSEGELSDFTLQMVLNPALRQEVESMRTVFKTLKTSEWSAPDTTASGSSNRLLVIAVAVLLLLLGGIFIWKGSESPADNLILPADSPATVPVAVAFTPNEWIENGLGLRDINVENNPLKMIKLVATPHKIDVRADFNPTGDKALLTIWNNQKEDFAEERFVVAKSFEIPANGQLNFSISHPLHKGLYYYQIEIQEQIVKVDRFEVR